MTSSVLNVRQIAQYPQGIPALADVMLFQSGGLGGPYMSVLVSDLINAAFNSGATFQLSLPPTGVIGWGTDPANQVLYGGALGGALAFTPSTGWRFDYANPQRAITLMRLGPDGNLTLELGTLTVARPPALPGEVVTLEFLQRCGVTSFNGRHGGIVLGSADIYNALQLHGTVATEQWVTWAINSAFASFSADDISAILTAPGAQPRASNPTLGDASNRIATTLFVDESLDDLETRLTSTINADLSLYAPLDSPNLTGLPTAPTANPGTHTGQLATTAFVMNAVAASTAGVSSFNTRTGAVVLTAGDVSSAGGALLASPTFAGTPAAPTATAGTSTTQLATTAFVAAAVAAAGGVSSFNSRTGAVTLSLADVTGTGVLANTALTGIPTAPTATLGANSTQVATTAFVQAALATGVTSFMGRTGSVTLLGADVSAAGGALVASPTFTGVPAAPTATVGTNTTQLATTAFVQAAVTAGASGVTSFNSRAGAVTLNAADITGAGGALLAGPTFTGAPSAPTATAGTSTTQLATTAFVMAALPGATPGWTFALAGGVSTQTALAPALLNLASGAEVWNPADQSAVTLTNGNLTAASTNGAVRGTRSFSSGKYYFEYTVGAMNGPGTGMGMAKASAGLFASLTQAGTIQIASNGNIYVNGINTGVTLSFIGSAGTVIGVAVDLTAGLLWMRISPAGNWNGNAAYNPATGTGGISISALGVPLFPFCALSYPAPDSCTANFGASAYSGVVPSGFASLSSPDYQINNSGNGGILRIIDNTSASPSPASYLQFRNNVTGQPSIISTLGSDTNRSIQLIPAGTGTVQVPTMAGTDNSTAAATTAFVTTKVGGYLPLAGGTMSGGITIGGSNPTINLQKTASGQSSVVYGSNGASARWGLYLGNVDPETGSDAGSNFSLLRCHDNGSGIDNSLVITRATGDATFGHIVATNYGYACMAGVSGTPQPGVGIFNIEYRSPSAHLWIFASDLGAISFTSDYRVKKGIFDLNSMWDRVKGLRPVRYTGKEFSLPGESGKPAIFKDDDTERWGFIAHELQDTLLESAASGRKDAPNAIQSPDPWPVLAALTKALQEAMARIEALEAA